MPDKEKTCHSRSNDDKSDNQRLNIYGFAQFVGIGNKSFGYIFAFMILNKYKLNG